MAMTPQQFEEAVKSHGRWVRQCLLQIVKDYDNLDDLEQDVWAKAWASKETYDEEKGNPLTWLRSVAFSVGLDTLRKRGREPSIILESDLDNPSEMEEPDEELLDGSFYAPDPLDILIAEERSNTIERNFNRLTKLERQVLEMSEVHAISDAKMAAHFGCSEGAIRVAKSRAKQKLLCNK